MHVDPHAGPALAVLDAPTPTVSITTHTLLVSTFLICVADVHVYVAFVLRFKWRFPPDTRVF